MRKFFLILTALLLSLTLVVSAGAAEEIRQLFRNDDYIYEIMDDGSVLIHYYIGISENITVPAYIEEKPVCTIGKRAFYGTEVRSVIISEGIRNLEDEAFFYCNKLESVKLPASLESVGLGVFRDCMELNTVTFAEEGAMGGYMFYGCVNLEKVDLPDNTYMIPVGMFGYCKKLSEINLPLSTAIIDSFSFYSSGLVSVKLTPCLSSINEMAFAQSTSLESVIPSLSEGVIDYIAPNAFEGCPTEFPGESGNTSAESTDPTESKVPSFTFETSSPEPLPPTEPNPPFVPSTDPTEDSGYAGGDSCTTDELFPSESTVEKFPEIITQDGYYMGNSTGFYESEGEVILSVHDYVEKSRQELLSLAWNIRMLGDSNMDGKVNIKDATVIQKYSAKLIDENDPDFDYKNSDANTDGQVNIKDATRVQKLVAGLVESLC